MPVRPVMFIVAVAFVSGPAFFQSQAFAGDKDEAAVPPTFESCIEAGANETFCAQFPRAAPSGPGIAPGRLTTNDGTVLTMGGPIPNALTPPMQIRRSNISICGTDSCEGECGQEGCEPIPVVDILENGLPVVSIHPDYSYDAGGYTNTIGGMEVLSAAYATTDGLGVGVTLGDMFQKCAGAEAWYSYISGDFTLRCPAYPRMQFAFAPAAFVGDDSILGMGDGDRLPQSTLDMNGRIIKVGI